jgi:hypothetical protein
MAIRKPSKVIFLDIHLKISVYHQMESNKVFSKPLKLAKIPLYYFRDESLLLDLFFFHAERGNQGSKLDLLLEKWIKHILIVLHHIKNQSPDKSTASIQFNQLFPLLNMAGNREINFLDHSISLAALSLCPFKIALTRKKFRGRKSEYIIFNLLQPIELDYDHRKNNLKENTGADDFREIWEALFEAKILWNGD